MSLKFLIDLYDSLRIPLKPKLLSFPQLSPCPFLWLSERNSIGQNLGCFEWVFCRLFSQRKTPVFGVQMAASASAALAASSANKARVLHSDVTHSQSSHVKCSESTLYKLSKISYGRKPRLLHCCFRAQVPWARRSAVGPILVAMATEKKTFLAT